MLWRSSEAEKILKQDILCFVVFVLFLLFARFGFVCPVLYFFGIPCPACGMTRALASLARLDFAQYFKYNAFALPVLLCVVSELHKGLFKKHKKTVDIAVCAVALLNFGYYITRLINKTLL